MLVRVQVCYSCIDELMVPHRCAGVVICLHWQLFKRNEDLLITNVKLFSMDIVLCKHNKVANIQAGTQILFDTTKASSVLKVGLCSVY